MIRASARTGDAYSTQWSIRGNPAMLRDAATDLRDGPAERTDGQPLPGQFVMYGLARLLDAVAAGMHGEQAPSYEIVAAAQDLARHVLTYLPRGRPE